jgi:hypothetical protein
MIMVRWLVAVTFPLFEALETIVAAAGLFISPLRNTEEQLPDVVAPDAACEMVH